MAYRRIDDNDTVEIRRAQGGNKPETRTVAELNEYFSKEENTDLEQLQAQVGDYDPDTTESTITDDLEQLQADVQTTETGLLDRTAALEAIAHTAASGTPDAPVASSISIPIDTGISLDFTAKTKGSAGDSITIALLDPDYEGTLSVYVEGSDIAVTLGYGTEAITSTLADVKTAIDEDEKAAALVSVAITGEDTTLAIAVAKTALDNGADGTTGAAGAMLYDATGIYVSTDISTTAVSHWKKITFGV